METTSASRKRSWLVGWAVVYVLLIGGVVSTMFWARGSAIRQLSSPESLAAWQVWREDVVRQQTQAGPVERRVPKSDEPPALVLWRDYFGVLVAGAVLFLSALYWVIAWFVMGMLVRDDVESRGASPAANC